MEHLKQNNIRRWLAVLCICLFLPVRVWGADDNAVEEARNGIIEVQSGFFDKKGVFREMKSGSGFLISNKDGATYIATTCSNVSNTPRAIKTYCKKKKINSKDSEFVNSIRIIVKGDVAAQAEVVVKSAEQDYCILAVDNVVSQKEHLKLGDSTEVEKDDVVYALGFPAKAESRTDTMEYSKTDVKVIRGAVTGKEETIGSGFYIAHSAPVGQGNAGGPLLDADGYVIGLCCKKSPEEDTGVTYALPVNEIAAVLDNFSIYYGSRGIDDAYAQLEAEYQKCAGIPAARKYKSSSVEALEEVLASTEEMLNLEEPQAADLQEAYHLLAEAKGKLVPKTKKITVMVMLVGALDAILLIWFLLLAVLNVREKKKMEALCFQQQPAASGGTVFLQQSEKTDARQQLPPAGTGNRLQMVYKKTGKVVTVNSGQFIIGKSREMTDFCIADNQAVSRKHASFYQNNGEWFIGDMDSLNGTFVNGIRVVPGQPVKVRAGDEIVLADEKFIVQGESVHE